MKKRPLDYPKDNKENSFGVKVTLRQCNATLLLAIFLVFQSSVSAGAVSTAREISDSRKIDREISDEQGAVTDPLLNAWVKRIGARLWQHVHRTDVPYSVKILDSSEVNAFTTGGGFIYLDEGVLDTVGSDDELAGVMGHETGHDEHRHPITLRQKGEVLSIVFGLAALFSPALAALGDFAGQGVMAKTSRTDEYQADEEGLHLLVKAGFDPQAMVALMRRLQALEGDADAHIDKYLADHPGLPDRIARLQRMAPIAAEAQDPLVLKQEALSAQAECRYAIAETRLRHYVTLRPHDPDGLLALGEVDEVLGEPARALQALYDANDVAPANDRARIAGHLADLHADERMQSDLTKPVLAPLRAAVIETRTQLTRAAMANLTPQNDARATLAAVQSRMDRLEAIAPQLDDQSATEKLTHEIAVLGRTASQVIENSSTVINGVGTLVPGKETGLWSDSLGITRDMATTIVSDDVPLPSRAVLNSYPAMNAEMRAANNDFASATSGSYAALLKLDKGLNALENLFHAIERQAHEGFGKDAVIPLRATLDQTQLALLPAVQESRDAYQAYNRGRSRQLQVRLDELNIKGYPDRERGFAAAVAQRLQIPNVAALPSLSGANESAGEYAAANILAADLGKKASDLLAEAEKAHVSVIDLPSTQAADHEALEIFLGLIYMDYTDDAALAEFTKTGSAH